jgi:iron complex outermembrane receptor protein
MYPDIYSKPGPFLPNTGRTSVARYTQSQHPVKDQFVSDTNAQFDTATGVVKHKVIVGFDHRQLFEHGTEGYGYDATPFNLYNPVYGGATAPDLKESRATRQSLFGLYAQDQMRLDRWIAVASFRRDFVYSDIENDTKQRDAQNSMRLGLMYELPSGMTPYVSYAQSFNPILGGGICVGGFCKPQLGEQYEVGFKYKYSQDVTINGAIFDITEKNRLAASDDPSLLSIQTGKVSIQGAELEVLAIVWRDLDLIASYTYLDTEVLSGDTKGNHIEVVPEQQASLWAKYRFALFGTPGFSAGVGVRYIGQSWGGLDTLEVTSYTLYDAMLAYENANWRFQINGTNLSDEIHVTTCLSRGDCFWGARRTVLSSLTYKF